MPIRIAIYAWASRCTYSVAAVVMEGVADALVDCVGLAVDAVGVDIEQPATP
jgi:hypothetical protein